MTPHEQLRPIVDRILATYTTSPLPGLPPPVDPDTIVIGIEWPGTQLGDDYRNARSPLNPNGLQAATESISTLVDVIPAASTVFARTGQSVEDLYELVLQARVDRPDSPGGAGPSRSITRGLRPRQTIDAEARIKARLEADEREAIYANAAAAAVASKRARRRTRGLTARSAGDSAGGGGRPAALETAVLDAWEQVQGARGDQGSAERGTDPPAEAPGARTRRAFAEARQVFDASRLARIDNLAARYRASYLRPSDFWKSDAWLGWPQDAFVDPATAMSYSARYARLDISRPWLDLSLFREPGWRLDGFEPGGLSTGTATGNAGRFPLAPTSILVVRDLVVRDPAGRTLISSSGLQSIAWISTVVPFSPPELP